jgi:carboxyl-terminal processing protease
MRRLLGIAVLIALTAALAVRPAGAAPANTVLSALDVLERDYVGPVHPLALLNVALAAARAAARVSPDVLPPLSAGLSEDTARRSFLREFDAAAGSHRFHAAQLEQIATNVMLASLHDSHTYFLGPAGDRALAGIGGDAFGGIGVAGKVERDPAGARVPIVIRVYPNSPGGRAGLRPLDAIVVINGASTAGFSAPQLEALFGGAPGTDVHLVIRRGGATRSVTVTRGPVTADDVRVDDAGGGIALVRIGAFSRGVTREIEDGLAAFPSLHGVILDLRDNPGGLVSTATNVASLFLTAGTPVYTVLDPYVGPRTYVTGRQTAPATCSVRSTGWAECGAPTGGSARVGRWQRLPLAVLINRRSASAAELVASAIQAAHRGSIIGSRSAGALEIALMRDLPIGAMSVTVERIATPSGRVVEGHGVLPDLSVRETAWDVYRGYDRVARAAAAVLLVDAAAR